MSSNILIPRIALFSEIEEPLDYKVFVYGTKNSLMIDADTFGDALARYLKEYNISYDMFARMTGIGKGSISRYLKIPVRSGRNTSVPYVSHSGFTLSGASICFPSLTMLFRVLMVTTVWQLISSETILTAVHSVKSTRLKLVISA